MPPITLAQQAKIQDDELVVGIIEEIVEVNEIFELMPFHPINGNSIAYNRERTLGDVQMSGVGATITAKNPATWDRVNSNLTRIVGDAEIDGLQQATDDEGGNDNEAIQIASKAKACGRQYQDKMINGSGVGDEFPGLIQLCADDQIVNTGPNGLDFVGDDVFQVLDDMLAKIKDKEGRTDYFMMNVAAINKVKAAYRSLGGASIMEVMAMPSGRRVLTYSGVPIFRNDWIPTNQVKGSSSNCTTIFAGTFDDGSKRHGLAGLTPRKMAGISLKDVGEKEEKDEHIMRVVWYCGLALFSELGLSMADGIKLR